VLDGKLRHGLACPLQYTSRVLVTMRLSVHWLLIPVYCFKSDVTILLHISSDSCPWAAVVPLFWPRLRLLIIPRGAR